MFACFFVLFCFLGDEDGIHYHSIRMPDNITDDVTGSSTVRRANRKLHKWWKDTICIQNKQNNALLCFLYVYQNNLKPLAPGSLFLDHGPLLSAYMRTCKCLRHCSCWNDCFWWFSNSKVTSQLPAELCTPGNTSDTKKRNNFCLKFMKSPDSLRPKIERECHSWECNYWHSPLNNLLPCVFR